MDKDLSRPEKEEIGELSIGARTVRKALDRVLQVVGEVAHGAAGEGQRIQGEVGTQRAECAIEEVQRIAVECALTGRYPETRRAPGVPASS